MSKLIAQHDIRDSIRTELRFISGHDFSSSAQKLLDVLGYKSQRTLPNQTGKVDDFINMFPAYLPGDRNERNTKSDEILHGSIHHLRFLYQLTDDEITADKGQISLPIFEINEFDQGWAKSFIFVVAELKSESYPRGKYAQFTREINRRFSQPVVVLFKTTSDLLTVAFVHRREHKRNPERDVLGNVSLIREIDPKRLHRAHLDILSELSLYECLQWIDAKKQKRNFDGLLAAWLDKLNTDKLNQKFYKELFDWFNRAVDESRFPTDEVRTLSGEEHVIRLITRLLFVWFIKEKGLVSDELFNEATISDVLVNYKHESGDSYYRAILQNLFFATLNTEIDKRGFSKETYTTHRNFSLYRYQREIREQDKLLALFAETPFINGGLFDCLDSEEGIKEGGYRIDCFSDVHYKKLSIPNRLFFDDYGLFPLLNRYKFTVEENTPIEQEVALDPELLGRVFENLLAAYNPETRDTARKQTGSYYTPRAVVNYMVDEALVASLAEKAIPKDGDMDYWQDRLRYLLDYKDDFSDANELFEIEETESILKVISGIKVLDPAVGSGAFPMGILHKLTLVLQRIDPNNRRWQALQKERAKRKVDEAFETRNQQERDAELLEISNTFERYSSDFGRKLYLIQNSIFGVDIQPIACQIAKLRFFISLAIEQEPDQKADNFGIKPLPNLETKFVIANTLLGLDRPKQAVMGHADEAIIKLELKLNVNRERNFHASTREKKRLFRKVDAKLREELAAELKKSGFPLESANKIVLWDAHDQNAQADWFDPEYMFGITSGFDIVICNPPYVEARSNLISAAQKTSYYNQVNKDWDESLQRGSDLLIYFYARSPKFMNSSGYGCFITQNAWLNTDYGKKFQNFSIRKISFHKIVDTSSKFFSDTKSQNINAVVTVFSRRQLETIEYAVVDTNMAVTSKKNVEAEHPMKWGHLFSMPKFYSDVLEKITLNNETKNLFSFGQGLNFPFVEEYGDENENNVHVIAKNPSFVATSTDAVIQGEISEKRRNKIPALFMPRGIGDRHYCAFNECKAFTSSFVELYMPSDQWGSDTHYCLWAYMNSSFIWLFREITGRKNLGGGLLKAEATDMKILRVNFDFDTDFTTNAKGIFERLKNRAPKPVLEEILTEEHLLIDDIVAEYFGFQKIVEKTRRTLAEHVNFRLKRARL